MIASLKRQDLYEVSIVIGKESYGNENDWINDSDAAFGALGMSLSPILRYLTKFVEYPKDLWKKMDRTFGKNSEDHNSTSESTPSTTRFLDAKFLGSTLSVEVVQDEEVAESST